MQPPGHTAHHPDYTNLAFSERLYCPVRRKQEQKVSNKKGALTENINCSLWFKTVFIKIAVLRNRKKKCHAEIAPKSKQSFVCTKTSAGAFFHHQLCNSNPIEARQRDHLKLFLFLSISNLRNSK